MGSGATDDGSGTSIGTSSGRRTALLDGRLSLTTPEGVRLLLTPAGPFARALAWSFDFLLWTLAVSGLVMVLPQSKLASGIYALLLFLSYWGYPILCEVYCGGRTLGKHVVGIRVLRADGLPVGWRESSLRNLVLVADFMPVCYASGLVCMLYDTHFRRLGDIVAGTLVVYTDTPAARASAQGVPGATPLAPPFPLSAAQQRTLADLFERESGLAPERVAELGTVAEPLTGLTGAASVACLRRYVAGLIQ